MNTLAIVWDPPLGIDLGFFMIRYYSLMFVIAFALGYQIMKQIFKVEKVEIEKLDKLLMFVVYFSKHPEEILLPFKFKPTFKFTGFAGLASHGAAISIVISLWYCAKYVFKKPLLYLLDRVALTIACGGVFVRLGNLLNSEIIGYPTNSKFGFIFKALGENFARHPTQLYESLGYLIVFAILYYLFWKTNTKEKLGFIFGVFFTLLWSVRFFVEFFKEAQVDDRASWALNTGQWLSIPLILIGVFFIVKANSQKP